MPKNVLRIILSAVTVRVRAKAFFSALIISILALPASSLLSNTRIGIDIHPTRRSHSHTHTHTHTHSTSHSIQRKMDMRRYCGKGTPVRENGNKVKGQGEVKVKGAIFVPIGPQCAGKTTYLTKSDAIDISIDDQDGVYVKVPSHLFLLNSAANSSADASSANGTANANKKILDTIVHSKNISDRIKDESNNEMRWIAQRLCNQMVHDDFRNRIMSLDRGNATQSTFRALLQQDRIKSDNNTCDHKVHIPDWRMCVIEAVEENMFRDRDEIFETVDLFVLEAIFQNPPSKIGLEMHTSTGNGTDTGTGTDTDPDMQMKTAIDTKMEMESKNESIRWPSHIADRPLSGLAAASAKLKYLAKEFGETSLGWGNTNAVSLCLCNHCECG